MLEERALLLPQVSRERSTGVRPSRQVAQSLPALMTAEWQMEEQQILLAVQGLEQASPESVLEREKDSRTLTVHIFYMLRRNQQNRPNC